MEEFVEVGGKRDSNEEGFVEVGKPTKYEEASIEDNRGRDRKLGKDKYHGWRQSSS